MKRLYIYSSIVSVILLLSACGNSWLDEMTPQNAVETEKSINTPTEAAYAVNGLYNLMRNYQYYGARYTYYGDATGEDMQARTETKRVAKYYLFQLNQVTAPSSFWSYPYKVIRNANRILNYLDTYAEEDLTDELKDLRGQCLTIRALAHFDLVRVFGEPYTKNNGTSDGIPIVIEHVEHDYKPSRNSVAEVYEQVIKDLIEGEKYISKSKTDGKINWYTNQHLLSRVYLYKGDNENAYKISTEMIAAAESSKNYALWTNEEYADMWKLDASSELLFILKNNADEVSDSKEFIGYLMHSSGYDDIVLSSDYMDLINEDKSDIRKKIISTRTKDPIGNFLLKYVSPKYDYAHIPVMRLSETYLIAAEAAVKLGDVTNANKYLNAIVTRANPKKSVTEAETTLERILIERRKELVGEGHRLFDAMRNNQTITRSGESHLTLSEEAKSFDRNFYKIILPIPRTEMNANPNIKQNPGYGL